jgi:hypothetical protein|tara:strand:- start:4544 stop:5131 length:588 start_codon:yes stop_codon:yes gene_type:complete
MTKKDIIDHKKHLVTCGECGEVNKVRISDEKHECDGCGYISDACDFPDYPDYKYVVEFKTKLDESQFFSDLQDSIHHWEGLEWLNISACENHITSRKHMIGNRLIAEFMGFTKDSEDLYLIDDYALKGDYEYQATYVNEMKYHTSWDWLMTAVKECYESETEPELGDITHGLLDCDLESTHQAVVEFINQHNKTI